MAGEVNTYSIVGRCARTGELGAAVASAVPAVGAICLFMRSGVGAVSTQSWVNPYLAVMLLDAMAAGQTAQQALDRAMAADPAADFRQLGVIGADGPSAAWTGAECTGWCGETTGSDHGVQGNMMTGPEVLQAMSAEFARDQQIPLEERLLRALEAGQAVGGDKRGRQAAALAVIGAEDYRRVDLRVDEHPDPVVELRRVYKIASAQLAPFVAGMPRKGQLPAAAPPDVVQMLLKSPPERPGGGSGEPRGQAALNANRVGGNMTTRSQLDPFRDILGVNLDSRQIEENLKAFQPILEEIQKLRTLDLTDVHPVVIFDPEQGYARHD